MSAWAATVAAYLAVLVATATAVVLARRHPATVAPLGRVVEWAMRRRTTQLGLLVAWWWLGWHFVTVR